MKNKEQHIFPFLERLLDGAEVEWKPLGEVCEIKGRIGFRGYTRNDLVEQGDGAITLSPSNIINQQLSFENCSYVSWAKYEESPEIKVEPYDVIFTKTASVGKTALVKTLPQEATINPQLVLLKRIKCKPAYLAYILQNDSFQQSVKQLTGQGSVPNVSQSALAKILIPLPPLSVQEEIVRILDKFTTLEAELEAELDCRKRQYEYYRNQLLSFDMLNRGGQRLNNVNIKSLEEIVEIKRGRRLVRKELSRTGRYAVFQNSMTPLGYFDNSNVDGDSTFIISAGAAGEIGYSSVDFWAADDIYYFIPSAMVCSKYLYYFLLTKQFAIKGQVRRASVPRLAKSAFAKIQIPIPSLAQQQRIVSILDKFDTLVNSISEGLPKEIELRRKQYEYYRNQLLSFPEHKVSA